MSLKPLSTLGIFLIILLLMSGLFSTEEENENAHNEAIPSASAAMAPVLQQEGQYTSPLPSTVQEEQFPCDSCDHIIYETVVSGKALNIKPGEVVCLHAKRDYSTLTFRDIKGTKELPVIIRNCDGVTKIHSKNAFGIKFQRSEHFKLLGDGSDEKYGLRITTEKGYYLLMELFTTDFEIANVEIAGIEENGTGEKSGFAGIGVKTSPNQDCDLFTDPSRKAWIMKNVSIHDNYVHDVGGEGIYMGHGFYAGRMEKGCSEITYSHSIQGVRIYANRIENVGFDGIQIKNADQDVEVYNNIVENYGTRNHGAHNEGLLIGDGTVGRFYGNRIDTGTGSGCFIHGMGDLYIYNNVFANQAEYGIYASNGPMVIRKPGAPFNIFNNTIYNSGKMGYVFFNNEGGPKRFINNLVVKTPEFTKKDATTELSNNVFTNDESVVKFINNGLLDYCVDSGSVAIDAGADLASYGIFEDCTGTPRPAGETFDIGAFEYIN